MSLLLEDCRSTSIYQIITNLPPILIPSIPNIGIYVGSDFHATEALSNPFFPSPY